MQHTYNHSGQMSTSIALTYDELLTEHVGQFGPGQLLSLFWASLHEIANAAALFIWVFLTVDAVANHNWRCTDPSDAVCMEIWRQDSPDSASFCHCALSSGCGSANVRRSLLKCMRRHTVCGCGTALAHALLVSWCE